MRAEYISPRIAFAARALRHRIVRQRRLCPYCGTGDPELLGRKKLLMELLRCHTCRLIFRYPTESVQENARYYESTYSEGATTGLPSRKDLARMISENFHGTYLDISAKIAALKTLRREGVVLDFGCSWGYGSYQLKQHGYEVVGFEISPTRAAYARRELGLQVIDDPVALVRLPKGSFDVVFTNHVIEHLPDPAGSFERFRALLADGGLAFWVLPNFGGTRSREGMLWSWIGRDHPIGPTREFFELNLPSHGFARVVCGSGPFDETLSSALLAHDYSSLDRGGDELLVIALKDSYSSDRQLR